VVTPGELALQGALERVVSRLPAGETRPGQGEMAKAVAQVLASEDPPSHLAVTAGTGTGKSLAYLVPAVLSGRQVVVATATKALQDQLALKDLPLLASALEEPFHWAVLKGRSNYLCRQRLLELEQRGEQEQLELGEAAGSSRSRRTRLVGDQVRRLFEFAKTTTTGDRAELDFEPTPAAWSTLSVGPDECPGAARCPSGADCFAERARARAAGADVLVVNHHLLGAHLASGGAVLPEYEALVVDEAHELEDTMADSLGVDLSPGRLRGTAAVARAALSGSSEALAEAVLETATRFELALGREVGHRLEVGLGSELGPVVRLVSERLRRLEEALRRATSEATGSPHSQQPALRALLLTESCRLAAEQCLAAGEETVLWVEGGSRTSLRSAPLDVSEFLSEQLFSKVPVVLTSATLAPGLPARLGASPDLARELDVGSPFDFRTNGLLYCAVGLPDRRAPGAEAAIHEELAALIEAAGGRTLGLFTSHRAMEAAGSVLRGRLGFPLHIQGDLPKAGLLGLFSEEEEACLFATMGFWQGVDVPGPSLSLVVIDRLPFPRPDDPLFSARREAAGRDGFRRVDLPRAATLLAQGAGRLIRSAEDKGVVAVLDPRLATASYAGYLVAALPPLRRTRDREVALGFLRSLRAEDSRQVV
jgi:ATP-dependent DNA helicase DinG